MGHSLPASLTTAAVALIAHASAFAQVNAELGPPVGSSVEIIVSLSSFTDFGFLEDEQSAAAAVVTGDAQVTLYPASPPFTNVRVHDLAVTTGATAMQFVFANGNIVIDVTIDGLAMSAPAPFDGSIAAGGTTTFDIAPIVVTGSVHVVNDDQYPMDIVLPFEQQLPLFGRIRTEAGDIVFDQIATPPTEVEFDPEVLPMNMAQLFFEISFDSANLRLVGTPTEAIFGDADADGDVDLDDYIAFNACTTGQAPIGNVYCTIFDFVTDGRINLRDWGGFQAAFDAP